MPLLSLEVAVHSDQHRRLISIDMDMAIKDANNECQVANKRASKERAILGASIDHFG
jgi:hypothetical protein